MTRPATNLMTTQPVLTLRALLVLLAVAVPFSARATTYFVDAVNGKDTLSGTAGFASAGGAPNGPWQTLARVARATLLPGDAVLLHCDQKWHESLLLNVDGTPAAPIALGHYSPTTCGANPIITGALTIPSYAWTRQTGSVYQVKLPANMVNTTGTTASLRASSTTRNHKLIADPKCTTTTVVCASITSGTSATTATTGNFPVTAGSRLNVSYQVVVPVGVRVRVITRRAVAPFDSISATRSITGTGRWQVFNYPSVFTATASAARIEFVIPAGSRKLSVAGLRVTQVSSTPLQVLEGGTTLAPAHHPNRGFGNPAANRVFASLGVNSDRLQTGNGVVSTFLTPGADFVLPSRWYAPPRPVMA